MNERFVDLETVVDLSDIIDALQDLSTEELVAHGLSATNTWDEIDDPVLIGRDGLPIETWREGYPYRERMERNDYEITKRLLQIELLKAQAWIHERRVRNWLCCSRDVNRRARVARSERFVEHLNPRGTNVVALSVPSEHKQRGEWYFQRYVKHLPTQGEIVPVRSILVQPRRGRAGDGLLHR